MATRSGSRGDCPLGAEAEAEVEARTGKGGLGVTIGPTFRGGFPRTSGSTSPSATNGRNTNTTRWNSDRQNRRPVTSSGNSRRSSYGSGTSSALRTP